MTKKYIRVDVSSIDDLPKKKGLYYSFAADEDENLEPEMVIGEYNPKNRECVNEWTKFCKWYLIEEPEEAQREELTDILNCIAGFDKDASIEEKGRYFESIQRDIVNYLKTK